MEHRIAQAEARSTLVKDFIKTELERIDQDISASRDKPDSQRRDQGEFENLVFSFPAAKKADRCGVKIGE